MKSEELLEGKTSFDIAELAKYANDGEHPNAEAYRFLDQSVHTSSHLTRKSGEALDDVYPITKEECEEMTFLLKEADLVVKEQDDDFYKQCSKELKQIARWSGRRHLRVSWLLIAGCALSLVTLYYLSQQVYFVLLLILLPLYLISCCQWGYVISRYRAERKRLNWLERAGVTMVVAVLGVKMAQKVLPNYLVKRLYPEDDLEETPRPMWRKVLLVIFKLVLLIVGLAVFCCVSILLMIYITFTGLYRNYAWRSYYSKVRS